MKEDVNIEREKPYMWKRKRPTLGGKAREWEKPTCSHLFLSILFLTSKNKKRTGVVLMAMHNVTKTKKEQKQCRKMKMNEEKLKEKIEREMKMQCLFTLERTDECLIPFLLASLSFFDFRASHNFVLIRPSERT